MRLIPISPTTLSYVGFGLQDRADLGPTLKSPPLSCARLWELGQRPELSVKSTSVMVQLTPRQAASSELPHRARINLGTCDLAITNTARDRADGTEGLPLAPLSQPEALSSQLGGNWDLLPPWDAPGSHSRPSCAHRTPEGGMMGCLLPSSTTVAGLDCFDFGSAGRGAGSIPYSSKKLFH